jgi:hypothetical protein
MDADGWAEDWYDVFAELERDGLPVVWALELLPPVEGFGGSGLWALTCNVSATQRLPREAQRPFLHLSLCFPEDGVWEERLEAVRAAWHGRAHRLRGHREGSTFKVDPADPVALCPWIAAVHSRGGYWWRPLHISM